MKHFLLISLMMLGSYTGFSQYFRQNQITYSSPMHDSLVRKAGIAEITETYVYIPKKGKHYTSKKLYQYDQNGHPTFQCTIVDTLKMKSIKASTAVNHTTSGNNGSSKVWRFENKQSTSILIYDASERVSEYYIYNNRGNLSRIQKVYYKDSAISRINTYNKKSNLQSYYLYEYNGKKLKSTGLYNKHSKLIRFWNYNCDDAGTMQKQKDTTTYCTSKTYLYDGSSISTTNFFDEKGVPIKSVYYLDSHGKTTKFLYYYGKNEALLYYETRTYINHQEATLFSKSFTKNGKAYYSSSKVFDAKHQVISHLDSGWYTKKPFNTKKTYTYNDAGLLTKVITYKADKISNIQQYRYRYFIKKD